MAGPNRFPEGVPRIGGDGGQPQPKQVDVERIVVFLNRPDTKTRVFDFPVNSTNPNDWKVYQFNPTVGLQVEKVDHTQVFISFTAIAEITFYPRKVDSPEAQVSQILEAVDEEVPDGEES